MFGLKQKPNWGAHPNKMAAALYFNRKRKGARLELELTAAAAMSKPAVVQVVPTVHVTAFDDTSIHLDNTHRTFDEDK